MESQFWGIRVIIFCTRTWSFSATSLYQFLAICGLSNLLHFPFDYCPVLFDWTELVTIDIRRLLWSFRITAIRSWECMSTSYTVDLVNFNVFATFRADYLGFSMWVCKFFVRLAFRITFFKLHVSRWNFQHWMASKFQTNSCQTISHPTTRSAALQLTIFPDSKWSNI